MVLIYMPYISALYVCPSLRVVGVQVMIVLFIVLSRIKHRIPLGRVRTP